MECNKELPFCAFGERSDSIIRRLIFEKAESIVPFQQHKKVTNFGLAEVANGKFLVHELFKLIAIDIPLIASLGADDAKRNRLCS